MSRLLDLRTEVEAIEDKEPCVRLLWALSAAAGYRAPSFLTSQDEYKQQIYTETRYVLDVLNRQDLQPLCQAIRAYAFQADGSA